MTPHERSLAFINDIVEVCKKHKVMIAPDDFDETDVFDIAFVEHGNEQFMFHIGLVDLERAIRENVWPIVHSDWKFILNGDHVLRECDETRELHIGEWKSCALVENGFGQKISDYSTAYSEFRCRAKDFPYTGESDESTAI